LIEVVLFGDPKVPTPYLAPSGNYDNETIIIGKNISV
jgi:hypothetical protein